MLDLLFQSNCHVSWLSPVSRSSKPVAGFESEYTPPGAWRRLGFVAIG